MGKDEAGERLYGPQLVFEERSLKCGYAPRTLLVSSFHPNTLFVGCKDGSVTVLSPGKNAEGPPDSRFLALSDFEVDTPGGTDGSQVGAGAVRAVCEWDASHLLLARSGGSLETLRWREPGEREETTPFAALAGSPTDPVRYLVRMDDERIAVAYRDEGLHVLHRSRSDSLTLRKVGEKGEEIRSIRAILPLRRGKKKSSTVWFLLTDRGDLYQWSGRSEDPPHRADSIWEDGRRPSLVSDSCLLKDETAREKNGLAEELLIATDRGLYLLFFEDLAAETPSLRRMALSGLNATPMVLAYTSSKPSDQGSPHEYLWVTDLQGDSHLFWSDDTKRERSFWRSGVHQAHSETLACAILSEEREKPASDIPTVSNPPFFVVQVRRDDRIVLGRYWNPNETEHSGSAGKPRNDLDLRELLNFGIYKGAEKAGAIRAYLKERFEEDRQGEYEMQQNPEDKDKGWWNKNDAAIVAELFEYLAEDEDRRRVLLESLRAPYAETAKEVLASGIEGSEDASRLWRLALLGILHRSPGDQTSSYLGLMRWLRHRQVELPKEGFDEISRRLDKDLLLVRKWGLRGGVNYDREDLVGPQRTLAAQEKRLNEVHPADREELERLRWERLTYRAELFGRNISLIHENDQGRLRGRTAWSTSVLPHTGGTLVAVSWMWGGVELFNLRDTGQGPELEFLAGDYGVETAGSEPHTLRRERLDPSKIVPAKYGYSRIVHLGTFDSQTYLLSAPASEPAMDDSESRDAGLFVWFPDSGKVTKEIKPQEITLTGVGRASIYSLLDLGGGRLVAGLGGEGPQPALILIDIPAQQNSGPVYPKIPAQMATAPLQQGEGKRNWAEEPRLPGRNRMWSLARLPEVRSDHFRIAFGCDSGEIYEVTINWQTKNTESSPTLIGRMGSPVQVLTCRPGNGIIRVFAGGEDGAIVAWQEISREERPIDNTSSPSYGTLWATVEQGAISQIHCLEIEGDHAVLVVTREGRYVTFDDRDKIDSPPNPLRPSRVPMPGSRHGRHRLNSSAFASSLIENPGNLDSNWDTAAGLGAFTALLVATNDGRIRLVSLHSPEAFKKRKQEYQEIVTLWHEVLQRPLDFRLTEAAYKASPALSLIVVRYLLDHRLDEKHFSHGSPAGTITVQQALEESPWCLPRHLRPLFRLRLLWDLLHSEKAAGTDKNYKLFEDLLSAALDRAWRLNDLDLFQEICQVVLRQANSGLYRAVEKNSEAVDPARTSGERPRSTKEVTSRIFLSVLHAVEHSLPRWLSTDRQIEARARIAVAKHLVDGETVRVLLREVAQEEEGRKRRLVQRANALQAEGSRKAKRGPFGRVFDERIRAVRELVNKRHPLVSLESLRAANLSLARMCRALVETRKKLCESSDTYEPSMVSKNPDDCEVSWPVFQDYSDELIMAAVRAFRTPLELNDALAHEFSRTFALFICACPSATLPIESLLTERLQISDPELEKGIFHRVFAQLKVLRAIGIGAPVWADELLRLGTQFPPEGWDWASGRERFPTLERHGFFNYREGGDFPQPQMAGGVGEENAENLGNIRRVYNILQKLEFLIKNLETTARDLDLSPAWREEILTDVKSLKRDHRQSREFLEKAFKEFPASDSWKGDLRKVRPETVRRSQRLTKWAEDCLTDIVARAREGNLFQPEVTTYSRVFRRLARAAENFPTSAAVQTNVVQGVLGHHLLEDLDEHALELEEIAEVLNPRKVWDFRDQGRHSVALLTRKPETSTAEEFARYLLGRAIRAESIPKNLRMLQALLGSPEENGDHPKSFDDLVEPYRKTRDKKFAWSDDPTNHGQPGEVSWHEARYLSLVLAELNQNQRKHAWPGDWEQDKLSPTCSFPAERRLILSFPFAVIKAETPNENDDLSTNIGRLRYLKKYGLSLIDPNQNVGVSSSGTGFYLADLAAAIVNWRLDIECPPRITSIEKPRAECFTVTLAPYKGEEESWAKP